MYDGIVQELIDEFGRLPGIGPKSAQRIAFHILQTPSFDVARLSELLTEIRVRVRFCEICGNVSEQDRCAICRDPRRNAELICVVEDAKDVAAIERTREFRGLYHVLGGAISPIAGVGPDDLRIAQLKTRLAAGTVHGDKRHVKAAGRHGYHKIIGSRVEQLHRSVAGLLQGHHDVLSRIERDLALSGMTARQDRYVHVL